MSSYFNSHQKLLESMEKDIAEKSQLNTLTLTPTDWNFFVELMNAPICINKNLQKAVKDFQNKFGE